MFGLHHFGDPTIGFMSFNAPIWGGHRRPINAPAWLWVQGDGAASNFWNMLGQHMKQGVQEVGISKILSQHRARVVWHMQCVGPCRQRAQASDTKYEVWLPCHLALRGIWPMCRQRQRSSVPVQAVECWQAVASAIPPSISATPTNQLCFCISYE